MAGPLRAAVIGVGNLGRHHARIYASHPGAQLVAVVDRDSDRAAEIAGQHGAPPLTDFRDLAGGVDAVSVAVPTISHHDVARALLEKGVHVLVEKPMTRTLEEADSLIEAAARAGRVLHVGHTERFNPAVRAAQPLVRRARFIECERLNPFAPRSLDVDVVLDLMIHDLDVILSLVGRPVEAVDAIGVNALTEQIDIANVRLKFRGGAVANVTASRISLARSRKLRIFQPDSYLSIDYPSASVQHYVLRHRPGAMPEVSHVEVEVTPGEPLALEIDAFLRAAGGGDDEGVSGGEGRRALETALEILKSIEENRGSA
jgi:predicted dehydrogenase